MKWNANKKRENTVLKRMNDRQTQQFVEKWENLFIKIQIKSKLRLGQQKYRHKHYMRDENSWQAVMI